MALTPRAQTPLGGAAARCVSPMFWENKQCVVCGEIDNPGKQRRSGWKCKKNSRGKTSPASSRTPPRTPRRAPAPPSPSAAAGCAEGSDTSAVLQTAAQTLMHSARSSDACAPAACHSPGSLPQRRLSASMQCVPEPQHPGTERRFSATLPQGCVPPALPVLRLPRREAQPGSTLRAAAPPPLAEPQSPRGDVLHLFAPEPLDQTSPLSATLAEPLGAGAIWSGSLSDWAPPSPAFRDVPPPAAPPAGNWDRMRELEPAALVDYWSTEPEPSPARSTSPVRTTTPVFWPSGSQPGEDVEREEVEQPQAKKWNCRNRKPSTETQPEGPCWACLDNIASFFTQ